MDTLSVGIDPGGSVLRGISTLSDSFKPEIIVMKPEVALVPKQSLETYERNKVGSGAPESSAWVEYKGEYRALGHLAQKRFRGDLQLKKTKFELALPKVAGMVGVLAEKYGLSNGAAIRLGVLLPWGEYQRRAEFKELLTEVLANFRFRGKEHSFVLDTFICLPEGGGVLTRGRTPGSSLKEQTVYVVMVGFRDVSVLVVECGEMSNGFIAPLGMSVMLDGITSRVAVQDPHKLLSAICKAGKNVTPKALVELVENTDAAFREREVSNIRQAISDAREEYWMMLSQWLRIRVPLAVDEIILAGGTANYFRPELNSLFSSLHTNWCDELEKQLNNTFASQMNAKALHYRLTDVYGMFFYLCGAASQSRRASHV